MFDNALEQPLTIAMEGASFINSYARRDALQAGADARPMPPDSTPPRRGRSRCARGSATFSPARSRRTAARSSCRWMRWNRRAARPCQSAGATAGNKDEVLKAVGRWHPRFAPASATRRRTRRSARRRKPSPPVDRCDARVLGGPGPAERRQERARPSRITRAPSQLDPKFGRAYSGAATMKSASAIRRSPKRSSSRRSSLMGRMTDREKHRTLGNYYLQVTGNYEKSVDEYTALVNAYPADVAGHAQPRRRLFLSARFRQGGATKGSARVEVISEEHDREEQSRALQHVRRRFRRRRPWLAKSRDRGRIRGLQGAAAARNGRRSRRVTLRRPPPPTTRWRRSARRGRRWRASAAPIWRSTPGRTDAAVAS